MASFFRRFLKTPPLTMRSQRWRFSIPSFSIFRLQTHFQSAVLAGVLTLATRHAIDGCTPLFAVRSNTRASGKGLLVDAISIISTGRTAPHWPQVLDEDEDRKRLLTIALSGDPCCHIDNVTTAAWLRTARFSDHRQRNQ